MTQFPLISLISLFACNANQTATVEKAGEKIDLAIHSCDAEAIDLPEETKSTMMDVNMSKCTMPFGILIAADDRIGDAYVLKTAQVLAEILDQDRDGAVDDTAVGEELKKWEQAWLAMPDSHQHWESVQLPALQGLLGYDIIVPTWWMGGSDGEPDTLATQVIVEEVTHFITQFGWSHVHPAQLGVEDWSSIIAQETQRAQCDWWQHPENDCPDSPADSPGDCSDPNCDVVEFYQQVLIMRAGMQPGWLGTGFPQTKEELESKLSDEMKAMMDDPQFHQISGPLGFDY